MTAPNLTARALGAFRWAVIAAAAEAILLVAILAVLARLLAPRDFGVVATAMIFIGIIAATGRLGVGAAITQRPRLGERHVVTGFTVSAMLGALLAAAVWLAAPATSPVFDEPEIPAILAALSATFLIAGLGETSEHLLRRELRFRRIAAATLLSQAAGYGAVAVAMALLGYGAWSLVGGVLARHAVFAAAVLAFRPPPPRLGLGRREAAELLRFGTGFSVSSLLAALAGQGSRLVIASGLGAAPLGYYAQASRVAGAPSRLGLVLQGVLLPAMAKRQHRLDRVAPVYLRGVETISLLAVTAGVPMAVCAPEIVTVLFGPQWDAAAPILRILAAGLVFHACNIVTVPAIRALGAVYREAWRRALAALLMVAGVWAATRWWGLAGAAAAVVAARIALHLMLTQLALGLLRLDWPRLLRAHVPALWAGAWSAAALWAATEFARRAAFPAPATLAAGLAAWALAATAAVYAAPGRARPRSLRWALDSLPLAQSGAAGRALRFLLERLDRDGPATPGR